MDYSDYSLDELQQARSTINAAEFPERAAELDKLIAAKQAEQATTQATPPSLSQDSDADLSTPVRSSAVTFHGSAKAFFSIWVVNVLLTVLTLGVYSAWAKVRTYRYFYSNIEVDGHRFSYLAEPLQILKGRIVGVVLFGSYFLATSFSPILALIIMLILIFASPLLICMSIKFNMRMTAYRNVRFGFKGKYGEAFLVFLLLPFASIFTLYLLMPWALKKMDEFIVDNTTYGEQKLESALSTGSYYIAALGAVALAIIISFATFAILGLSMSDFQAESEAAATGAMIAMGAIYLAIYVVCSSFYSARIRNEIFNNSQIVDVATFESDVSFPGLLMLRLTNTLALVCSLGLAIPWVKVRNARFFADATQVEVLAGADNVMVDKDASASAVGDEVASAFDMDVALG